MHPLRMDFLDFSDLLREGGVIDWVLLCTFPSGTRSRCPTTGYRVEFLFVKYLRRTVCFF